MKRLAKAEFEAWAGSYDRSLLNHFLFRPSYLKFLEELHRWRGEDDSLFDLLVIGCGTGTFGAMLTATALPARVVGLDYAEAMCHVAEEKARGTGLGDRPRFVNADSEKLPFADESFDVVTCSNSFHHYPDQAAVVREFRRVLRPGGRLMLIDGFRDNVIGWFVFDVVITTVEKDVFHAPWGVIDEYFRGAGFRDISRAKFNLLFPLLLTVGTK